VPSERRIARTRASKSEKTTDGTCGVHCTEELELELRLPHLGLHHRLPRRTSGSARGLSRRPWRQTLTAILAGSGQYGA